MFPLTRAPFGVLIFDPQPCQRACSVSIAYLFRPWGLCESTCSFFFDLLVHASLYLFFALALLMLNSD